MEPSQKRFGSRTMVLELFCGRTHSQVEFRSDERSSLHHRRALRPLISTDHKSKIIVNLTPLLCKELEDLIHQLQGFMPSGTMLSQLDPAAGLGCHPFHITLLGGVHNVFSGAHFKHHLEAFLQPWTEKVARDVSCSYAPTFSITNQIRISPQGRVLLLIQQEDPTHNRLNQIGYEMYDALHRHPRLNDYYIRPETGNLHITIGTIRDPKYFRQTITIDDERLKQIFSQNSYSIDSFGWDY